jgi:prolipoprotein diacylglyceryltransferase
MYPEIFRIGSFPINTYGILLAIGLLLALYTAGKLASNDGLPRERIYDLGLWTIIGGLIGSKILLFFLEDNVNASRTCPGWQSTGAIGWRIKFYGTCQIKDGNALYARRLFNFRARS